MYKDNYRIDHITTDAPSSANFFLHCHDAYEILLFESGDSRFVVEDKTYTLHPGDIIIARKHEMHRIYHNTPARYQRFVLMVDPEFFMRHNCQEYEAQFLNTSRDVDNKISADLVRSSGLYDAFLRYKRFSKDFSENCDSPILIATVIEILYLINQTTRFSTADYTSGPIKSVIQYLNNTYTEDITLDMLAEKFYISKYYLCRAFHKATGLTVHDYIRLKRLTLARELKAEGKSISEAAILAGFSDYSSFYRAYVKVFGTSPRNDLT